MDAGFFRVSRNAGTWGEVGGGVIRKARQDPLSSGRGSRRAEASKILGILGSNGRSPLPCGGDRCAPAQSPPPESSPLRGGDDGRRKMAAGMAGSDTSPPGLPDGACRPSLASRRVLGPSGPARRKSLGGGGGKP